MTYWGGKEADAGEDTYKEIRKACDEKLAAVTADLEHAQKRWEAELSTSAAWQHRAEKAEAENESSRRAEMLLNVVIDSRDATIESLRRQIGLCNVDQANAEAENAALQDQLKLAQQWRTGYEKAKAENAALREWESRCAVALGVPGCNPEEMLHVIDNQREDAERYRWFRSKRLWDADQFPWPKDFDYPEPCLWDDGEMLDAAIDAVRKV